MALRSLSARCAALISFSALLATSPDAHAQVLAWANVSQGSTGSPDVSIPYAARFSTQSTIAVDAVGNTIAIAPARQPFGSDLVDDYYVLKVDVLGGVVWRRRVDGSERGPDMPYAVAVDAAGDVVVTGRTSNYMGGHDVLTVKLDGASGAIEWRSLVAGSDTTRLTMGRRLVISPAGDVFVAADTSTLVSGQDALIFKLSGDSGALLWQRNYQRNADAWSHDQAMALALDDDGHLLVACSTESAVSGFDASVLRLSGDDGAVVWASHLQGADGASSESAADLVLDPDGRIFLLAAGNRAATSTDYLTVALSRDGGELWRAWYAGTAGSQPDSPSDLELDGAGRVFVTGRSTNAAGNRDFATVAYAAADGIELWVARHDEPAANANDDAMAVAVHGDSVVVSGSSWTPDTGLDYLTIRYSAAQGQALWMRRHSGTATSAADELMSMRLDPAGQPTVVGVAWDGVDTSLDVVRYRVADGVPLWMVGEGTAQDEPERLMCNDAEGRRLLVDPLGASIVVACGELGYRRLWSVTKRDGSGQVQWRKQLDPELPGSERVITAAIDGAGDVLMAGAASYPETGGGSWMVKRSGEDGSELWRRHRAAGVSEVEEARAVVVRGDGDPVVAVDVHKAGGEDDVRVSRHDSVSGSELWVAELSSATGFDTLDRVAALAFAPFGDVVLVTHAQIGVWSNMRVTRFNGITGQLQWSTRYSPLSNHAEYPVDVAVDAQGDVFVVANSMWNGTPRMVVVKFDGMDGEVAWARSDLHLPSAGVGGTAIEAGADGDAVVAGYIVDEPLSYTMFTAKLAGTDGVTRWSSRAMAKDSLATQRAESLMLSDDGSVHVVGAASRNDGRWQTVIEKYAGDDGSLRWRYEYDGGEDSWYPLSAAASAIELTIAARASTSFGERVGLIKLLDLPPAHPDTLFADSFD